jgi:uncharacterized protein (DUF2342 family)
MSPTPKAEALTALHALAAQLEPPNAIDGLARVTLAATVQYAIAQVEKIEETLRPRRAKKGTPA